MLIQVQAQSKGSPALIKIQAWSKDSPISIQSYFKPIICTPIPFMQKKYKREGDRADRMS